MTRRSRLEALGVSESLGLARLAYGYTHSALGYGDSPTRPGYARSLDDESRPEVRALWLSVGRILSQLADLTEEDESE